jgi:CBS domain-containing protein
MEQKKLRRLAVLNDKKRLVGMLSLGDVAHSASHAITGEMTAAVASHHA